MKGISKFTASAFLLLALLFMLPKAAFANDGAGDYYIRVNLGTCTTTVYKQNGTPVKAMICSPGWGTKVGTYYTPIKYRWKLLLGPSYGQYCTRIYGGVLFHSVYYWTNGDKSSMATSAYNLLGSTESHGCIRLTVIDAKWIYDNCPLGTRVEIFRGSSSDDPLGKPSLMKINNGKYTNWDPTDPDPENPWNSAKPSIKLTGSRYVQYKSKFQPRAAITALDSLGNDITSTCKVAKGRVKTNKLGKYKITYKVTDGLGRTAKATITYIVKDVAAPTFSGAKNMTTAMNKQVNLLSGVSAQNFFSEDVSSSIKVAYYNKSSKTWDSIASGLAIFHKAGKYKIRYTATSTNGVSASKTITLKVVDQRVRLSSKKTIQIEYGTTIQNLRKYISIKTYKKKSISKSNITVKGSVNTNKIGTYTVTYTGTYKKSPYTKRVRKIKFKVVNKKAPIITASADYSKAIPTGTTIHLFSGVSASSATGVNLTNNLSVSVNGEKIDSEGNYTFTSAGTYTILYTITIPKGKTTTLSKTVIVIDPSPVQNETTTQSEETTTSRENPSDTKEPEV